MKRILLASAVALVLVGCGDKGTDTSAPAEKIAAAKIATPVEQINLLVSALKQNDVKTLMALSVPADDFAQMRSKYETEQKKTLTDEDRKNFDDGVGKLLADDGVDSVMKESEPKLAEMKTNLPMVLGFGVAMAQAGIQKNEDMTPAQKEQVTLLLNNAQSWAMKTDLADPARLRAALTAVRSALVASGIKSADDARKLSFDQAMEKGKFAMQGIKGALVAYDLDLDKALASIKPELLEQNGDSATVRVNYTLFDAPMTIETNMVQKNGRWISEEAEKAIKAEADTEVSG